MSTATARSAAAQPLDIPALVDSLHEVNKQARALEAAQGLRPGLRRELGMVLRELEHTVRVLRVAAGETPPAAWAPRQDATRAALALDTTEAMVDKGQLGTPVAFQQLMGWRSRQAVSKAAQSQRVFSVRHKAQRYFPAFFADPAYDRRHLEAVSQALGDLPGGSKLQFFLTRKGSLAGATPLQALAGGRVAKVMDVAAAFAEGA